MTKAQLIANQPFWTYFIDPKPPNVESPNDLVHHVYALWGLELYRRHGGHVHLP